MVEFARPTHKRVPERHRSLLQDRVSSHFLHPEQEKFCPEDKLAPAATGCLLTNTVVQMQASEADDCGWEDTDE